MNEPVSNEMKDALQVVRVGWSPWEQNISNILRAVETHIRAGRKWSHGKNKTTGAIVFHATELSDLADEIRAGKRDELGYEL